MLAPMSLHKAMDLILPVRTRPVPSGIKKGHFSTVNDLRSGGVGWSWIEAMAVGRRKLSEETELQRLDATKNEVHKQTIKSMGSASVYSQPC